MLRQTTAMAHSNIFSTFWLMRLSGLSQGLNVKTGSTTHPSGIFNWSLTLKDVLKRASVGSLVMTPELDDIIWMGTKIPPWERTISRCCYRAIQRSWFARVNSLCNLSRKTSREVAAHFRADFGVGVASRCV